MPCSIESSTATTASIPKHHATVHWVRRESLCQADKVWQDIASQAQERTKQHEKPDSPIKICPLAEVIWSHYQEQGEAESTE